MLGTEKEVQWAAVMTESNLGQIIFEKIIGTGFAEQLLLKIASDFKKQFCNASIKANTIGNAVLQQVIRDW